MSLPVPGIFEGKTPVDEGTEKAEILAKAFDLTSKKYFKRKDELNKGIQNARELIGEGKEQRAYGNNKLSEGQGLVKEGNQKREQGKEEKAAANKLYTIFGIIIGVVFLGAIIATIALESSDRGIGCMALFGSALLSILFVIPYNKRKKAVGKIGHGTELISNGDMLIHEGNSNINSGQQKIDTGEKEVERSNNELSQLRPEKSISFVSRTYLPFFLIPYAGGTMVFDALGGGSEEQFDLENLNVEAIENNISRLENKAKELLNSLSKETTLSPDEARKYDGSKFILEKPLTELIPHVDRALKDGELNVETVQIHKPDGYISECIRGLIPHYKNVPKDYCIISPTFSFKDAKSAVERLKGIKSKFSTSDIHEQAQRWMGRIKGSITPFEKNCEGNMQLISGLYDQIEDECDRMIHRQACASCFNEKKEDPMKRYSDYDLEEFVEKRFRTPINLLTEETRAEAKSLIKDEIDITLIDEKIGDKFMPAVYEVSPLDEIEGKYHCEDHRGEVEPLPMDYYAGVFSHTADSLWDELQEPVKDKVKEDNVEATRRREKFKDHLLSVLPYKQMYTRLVAEKGKISVELESGQRVLDIIDKEVW